MRVTLLSAMSQERSKFLTELRKVISASGPDLTSEEVEVIFQKSEFYQWLFKLFDSEGRNYLVVDEVAELVRYNYKQ